MATKEIKFSASWRYFLKTSLWGGIAGGLSMAAGEIWLGYDFHDSDYLFPLLGSAVLASSVNGLDSMYRLWKTLSVSRAFERPAWATVPATDYPASQPARRGIRVVAGNQNRNIFAKTIQWFAGNVEDDPDLLHHRVKYDKFMEADKIAWPVFLSNYSRRAPIVISDDFLFLFVSQVWDRQQDKATANSALSRPHFVTQLGYRWPEYYAMLGLIRHSIYGRGDGASGYLTTTPRRVINRTVQIYPGGEPVYL